MSNDKPVNGSLKCHLFHDLFNNLPNSCDNYSLHTCQEWFKLFEADPSDFGTLVYHLFRTLDHIKVTRKSNMSIFTKLSSRIISGSAEQMHRTQKLVHSSPKRTQTDSGKQADSGIQAASGLLARLQRLAAKSAPQSTSLDGEEQKTPDQKPGSLALLMHQVLKNRQGRRLMHMGRKGLDKASHFTSTEISPRAKLAARSVRHHAQPEVLNKDYRRFLHTAQEFGYDRGIERLFFVPAKGYISLEGLTINSPNRPFGHDYHPIHRLSFNWAMAQIPTAYLTLRLSIMVLAGAAHYCWPPCTPFARSSASNLPPSCKMTPI